jgi:uncharacterized protein YunC (DUF1805 family)
MDTAIIITGIIGLAAGLVLGANFWGHHADTVAKQAEEIDALNLNNLRLRGQCTELATQAHDAQGNATGLAKNVQMFDDMLTIEIEAHAATKRRLSAAKGQITKLRRMV